jgi:hypothetical protein
MIQSQKVVVSLFVALLVLPGIAVAQDPELPLTWEGEGKSVVMMQDGMETIAFDAKFEIDTDGYVKGAFSDGSGEASIERFYYGYENGGKRDLIMVLVTEESEPKLIILKGSVLKNQLYYGEVLVKIYEKGGEIEKGLYLDSEIAEEIYSDYLPKGLKNALKSCKAVGSFTIKGSVK